MDNPDSGASQPMITRPWRERATTILAVTSREPEVASLIPGKRLMNHGRAVWGESAQYSANPKTQIVGKANWKARAVLGGSRRRRKIDQLSSFITS